MGYMDVAELFHAFRLVSKPWQRIAEEKIDREFESGVLVFHSGKDIRREVAISDAREERMNLVTRVIFFQNITRVGEQACYCAANLVVVDISEGVERIGASAFDQCRSLTAVYFPTTLTSIGQFAFAKYTSLDNVDLLHTNLQELRSQAFCECSELNSMTIPDSLQRLGTHVFFFCSKLVPSNIIVNNTTIDSTSKVVAHFRSQQLN
ncbi:hypothetical protein TrLO_g895 [Triparma laevis f. longispina]|uniref:Uncharacterized protein n=1 Tax=Triparma laevis f. longispina TaxID=1714387 RepID=A0A9W7A271_9STRA|nr:hypothetical protein TrLO_g895 [Triparma laevis f. longispina]